MLNLEVGFSLRNTRLGYPEEMIIGGFHLLEIEISPMTIAQQESLVTRSANRLDGGILVVVDS